MKYALLFLLLFLAVPVWAASAEAENLLATGDRYRTSDTPVLAYRYYRRAASLGSREAMAALAELYSSGIGKMANAQWRDYWRERALAAGEATAVRAHAEELFSNGNSEEARRFLLPFAAEGSRMAASMLAVSLLKEGMDATKWLTYITETKEGKIVLATAYLDALPDTHTEQAITLLKEADTPRAWYYLARHSGSAELMGRSAKAGYAPAMRALAGSITSEDATLSFALLRQAAEAGDTGAMLQLGSRYANGEGVERNREKAQYWWQRAAAKTGNTGTVNGSAR